MKIISRRVHGLMDYAIVVAFLSLPTARGLVGTPRALSYSLAFLHLLLTGFTSFPLGPVPMIPARTHGHIELAAGLFLLVSPWLLGFSDVLAARNSFLTIGALISVLYLVTNYDRRAGEVMRPPGDRRRWHKRKE